MNAPQDPDLIKITEIYLVPSSFLVAALGTADTNPHRAMVSLIGGVISLAWYISSLEAARERHVQQGNHDSPRPWRTRLLSHLALLFLVSWSTSLVIHIMLWNHRLGT